MKSIHIGTSGWNYRHWKGPFYPPDLPSGNWFEYYMSQFDTVEINNTFYQLPEENTFKNWRDETPDHFIFSVKASRYITHIKRLKDGKQPVETFLGRVKNLGNKTGPILFQLPPRWNCNLDRLNTFIDALPREFRYVFEFRDSDWWNDQVFELLSEHKAAFCIFDLAGTLSPKKVTTDFVYVRLHGPYGPYKGQYDAKSLSGWRGAFSTWQRQGKKIYCYFDNDEKGYAPRDALRLLEMF